MEKNSTSALNDPPAESVIMRNWDRSGDPVVSICCNAYNHVGFISDAINGFLSQATNFPFEVLVHDDASTDGTQEVIRGLEKKYPKIIKPIYQDTNQYSKGKRITLSFNYPRAKGNYIAFCEGDDYWTDTNKLQIQVDYLEGNKHCSFCGHGFAVKNQLTSGRLRRSWKYSEGDYGFKDILHWHFKTPTLMFRKNVLTEHFYEIYSRAPASADFLFQLYLAANGKGHYIDRTMAVYRQHNGGVSRRKDDLLERLEHRRSIYEYANTMSDGKYHSDVSRRIAQIEAETCLKLIKKGRLQDFIRLALKAQKRSSLAFALVLKRALKI